MQELQHPARSQEGLSQSRKGQNWEMQESPCIDVAVEDVESREAGKQGERKREELVEFEAIG